MIVPAGKIRHQVNQGPYKNESLWDRELMDKFAVTGADLDPGGKPKVDPGLQDNLGAAMNQSNSAAISGKVPGTPDGRMPGEKEAPLPPAGGAEQVTAPRGSPASKFLGANPDDQTGGVSTQMIFKQEEAKIRKFIGNDFGLDLKANNDGSFTIKLTPPNQMPIAQPQQFIAELLKYLQGAEPKNLVSPPANQPGPISISYTPRALVKVQKA